MNKREENLLSAVLAAHEKMSHYNEAARITQSNAETVASLIHDRDGPGYLSEILRVGRQATALTELAKEAHDALAAVLEAARD